MILCSFKHGSRFACTQNYLSYPHHDYLCCRTSEVLTIARSGVLGLLYLFPQSGQCGEFLCYDSMNKVFIWYSFQGFSIFHLVCCVTLLVRVGSNCNWHCGYSNGLFTNCIKLCCGPRTVNWDPIFTHCNHIAWFLQYFRCCIQLLEARETTIDYFWSSLAACNPEITSIWQHLHIYLLIPFASYSEPPPSPWFPLVTLYSTLWYSQKYTPGYFLWVSLNIYLVFTVPFPG